MRQPSAAALLILFVVNEIGKQIQILIDSSYKTAQKILLDNMDVLDKVAQRLIEKEKISEEEFNSFFETQINESDNV